MVQLAKRPAGLDPELLDEHAARLLIRLERLRLTTRAVQGEHQLAAQVLPERVLADERLQLADQLGMKAARQLGLDPLFERDQSKLLETADLALSKRLIRE